MKHNQLSSLPLVAGPRYAISARLLGRWYDSLCQP